jgi:NAD-dependent deacetylase
MHFQGTFSDTLVSRCIRAASVTVSTGAGVSAESGVPTFRDPGGLWSKFRPEELASFQGFMRNPDLVWEWYSWRRSVISSVAPNPGHIALVEMETLLPDFTLITQNVDNLHRRAGSVNVIELHGNIERSYCLDCASPRRTRRCRPRRYPAAPAAACCGPTWCGSARRSRRSTCATRGPRPGAPTCS